jgi:hypothetical protein
LRQLLAGQGNACSIATCICDLAQLIKKSERLEYGSPNANAYAGIALFDALESWPAGEGAFRHNPCREPPTPSRIMQAVSKLAQGLLERRWKA